MIFVFFLGIVISGCGQLSGTAKSVFFTDGRGYDRRIVNEDLQKISAAIKANPNKAQLFVARGFIYATLHKYSRAISDFEKAEKIDHKVDINCAERSSIYYLLTMAHKAYGNRKETFKYHDMQPGNKIDFGGGDSVSIKYMNDDSVACFLSNKPPLLRPFGYVWTVEYSLVANIRWHFF